jgi:REP element-mobilizing transposase RayT
MSKSTAPLEPNTVYHIFTHAVHNNNLFLKAQDYEFFLQRWNELSKPFFTTYAYCLMPNHLHLCIQTKTYAELLLEEVPVNFLSRKIGDVLSSYAQSFNRKIGRIGTLYRSRFKRIPVLDRTYFKNLVCYLHYNLFHHFGDMDCAAYPYGSLNRYLYPPLSDSMAQNHIITPETVRQIMFIFGGWDAFQAYHQNYLLNKQFRHAVETKMAEFDKDFIPTLVL